MKLKPKTLEWKPSSQNDTEWYAILNKRILFEVRQVGKNNPKYIVFSYPLDTMIFTRANNSKKLGEYPTQDKAQEAVEEFYKQFILSFMQEA